MFVTYQIKCSSMHRATRLQHTFRRKFGGHADMQKPFEPPHVEAWHTRTGEAFMTVMWLWLFYKFDNDGAVLIGLEDHGFENDHGEDVFDVEDFLPPKKE